MEALKQAIREMGSAIGADILKVDGFLNHRIDTRLLYQMAEVIASHFAGEKPDLVLTVEASGIALASAVAHLLHDIPLVFCKKSVALNQSPNMAQAEIYSFTHKQHCFIRADLRFIPQGSRVLIVDDFLADGQAVQGMRSLIGQAGAHLAGVGIAIEKGFQPGGSHLRQQGINLLSLAVVDAIRDGHILCKDC
ncbi:MAG: xanthine phosphoribosyltransferase [Christensenellales bacterium]